MNALQHQPNGANMIWQVMDEAAGRWRLACVGGLASCALPAASAIDQQCRATTSNACRGPKCADSGEAATTLWALERRASGRGAQPAQCVIAAPRTARPCRMNCERRQYGPQRGARPSGVFWRPVRGCLQKTWNAYRRRWHGKPWCRLLRGFCGGRRGRWVAVAPHPAIGAPGRKNRPTCAWGTTIGAEPSRSVADVGRIAFARAPPPRAEPHWMDRPRGRAKPETLSGLR